MPYYGRRRGFGRGSGLAYSLMRAQAKARRIRRARSNAALGRRVKAAARAAGYGRGEWGTGIYQAGTEEGVARFGATWREANEAQRAARRASGIVGRGKYSFSKFRRQAASVGRTVGAMAPGAASIAALTGNPEAAALITTGGQIGNIVGGRGMYMAGRGSYAPQVEGNATIEGSSTSIPQFHSAGDETGAMVIAHREYVGDVYGNEWVSGSPRYNFLNVNFELNPGLARSFPFLSQIACNFEEYEFIQLMYTYEPKVSPNLTSTDGQVGSVLAYTDYNAGDAPKKSKQAMLQAYGSSNGRVIDTVHHGIECDPAKISGDGHKFIRVRPLGTEDSNDLKEYDAGLFQLAISNTPEALSNAVIGELHVSYRVLLRKPRTYSLYGYMIDMDQFVMTGHNAVHQCGSMNSIKAHMEVVPPIGQGSLSDRVNLKFTLPATLAGDFQLDVRYVGQDKTTYSPAAINGQGRNILEGEVIWLPVQPTGGDAGQEAYHTGTYSQTASVETCSFSSYTFHTEMAVSGTDNSISIQTPFGDTFSGTVTATLRRMNSRETETIDPSVVCETLDSTVAYNPDP